MKASVFVLPCLVLLTGCAAAPEADDPGSADSEPDVVGSWRLVEWTVADDAPRCGEAEGAASGQIVYAADGHMSAQLGCAELSMDGLDALSSTEVAGRMSRRHFSYYGTWTLDRAARTVTHHVTGSSAQSWVGTDRVRSFTFEGSDRIVLSTAESDNRLVWARN